ncbi:MAG TPA: hypothetical protein ENL08_02480 [Bacteroidetes bacterium]|nr:hypothetical protein [Bacteroidota bacterium]
MSKSDVSVLLFAWLLLIRSPPGASSEGDDMAFRLAVTSDLRGAIRECHCPHGQPAGLARRKTIFDEIRHETPDAVFIECGSLTDSQVEPRLLVDLLNELDYDLICCYMVDYERIRSRSTGDSVPVNLPLSFCNYTGKERGQPFPELKFNRSTEPGLMIITFTSLYNCSEADTVLSGDYQLLSWDETVALHSTQVKDFVGVTAAVCNWDYSDPDMQAVPPDIRSELPGLDLIIIGGSGYIEPEAVMKNGLLVVYPGVYGEYVLLVDLWSADNVSISRFEWEAIPTETARADPEFVNMIESYNLKAGEVERK